MCRPFRSLDIKRQRPRTTGCRVNRGNERVSKVASGAVRVQRLPHVRRIFKRELGGAQETVDHVGNGLTWILVCRAEHPFDFDDNDAINKDGNLWRAILVDPAAYSALLYLVIAG